MSADLGGAVFLFKEKTMNSILFGELTKQNTPSTSAWYPENMVNAEIQRLKEEHYKSKTKIEQRNQILFTENKRMYEVLQIIAKETESTLIRRLIEETLREGF